MAIRIIATGGTIDDLDHDCIEDMPEHHDSLIPDALEQACVTADVIVEVLMQKDSRIVTDEDRELMAEACRRSPEDQIVLTHETYSLEQTARYLGPLEIPKTIVAIDAMVPLNKDRSDALFNIGAGMARTYTAAAFVKRNMPIAFGTHFPLGQGGLTDQEAVDVAEYFSHMPRPDFPDKVKDWPKGGKPADARY